MTLYDAHYKHWQGQHLGLWRRRRAIATTGLSALCQIRWMRHLITIAWVGCVAHAMILFFMSQLMVPDSIVVEWLGNLNRQLQTLGGGLASWLSAHPEISVRTSYDLIAYFFATNLQTLAFAAIAIALPQLITRDLASNAIIIYSSKAVSRFDYFLGKFATVFGLLALIWLGPMCVAWFAGNLLSTHWHFFWHSRATLGHELLFILIAMFVLSLLALGVSAISSRVRSVVVAWIALWLLGNALVPISQQTQPWLKFFSFSYDLHQLARSCFTLRANLQTAEDNIPIIGTIMRGRRGQTPEILLQPEVTGALCALGIMVVIALFILWKRIKPE
jgi:hypothetical protein